MPVHKGRDWTLKLWKSNHYIKNNSKRHDVIICIMWSKNIGVQMYRQKTWVQYIQSTWSANHPPPNRAMGFMEKPKELQRGRIMPIERRVTKINNAMQCNVQWKLMKSKWWQRTEHSAYLRFTNKSMKTSKLELSYDFPIPSFL